MSPGEEFELSLGVDDAVRVRYPQGLRRVDIPTGGGFLASAASRQRTIHQSQPIELHYTKRSAVRIRILDQLPESESEALVIKLLEPELVASNANTNGSASASNLNVNSEEWPEKMTAQKADNGCIEWRLTMQPGERTRLALRYDITHPVKDTVLGL